METEKKKNNKQKKERNSKRYQYKYMGWNIEIGTTLPEQKQVYYIRVLQNIILKTDNIDSKTLKRDMYSLVSKNILSIPTINENKHIEVFKLFDDWNKRKSTIKNNNNVWTKSTISMELHLIRKEPFPNSLKIQVDKKGTNRHIRCNGKDYLIMFVNEIKPYIDTFITNLTEIVNIYNTEDTETLTDIGMVQPTQMY